MIRALSKILALPIHRLNACEQPILKIPAANRRHLVLSKIYQLYQTNQLQQKQSLTFKNEFRISQQKETNQERQAEQVNYKKGDIQEWANSFPECDDKLKELAQQKFGISQLKDIQKAIIKCSLQSNNVFVCMPTGGGKSLIYQMLAYYEPGIYICVMPLISLMLDQVKQATKYGIKSYAITKITPKAQKEIYRLMTSYQPKSNKSLLIFCSPEKLKQNQLFRQTLNQIYSNGHMKKIIIDEIHCVETWGKDFRPSYRYLKDIKQRCDKVPIIALTATAREQTKRQIIKNIGMQHCYLFQSAFTRLNLYFQSRKKDQNMIEEVEDILKSHQNQSIIIYCLSRRQCEVLASYLKIVGYKAQFYHAKITIKEKNTIQAKWMKNQIDIIVSTIAFGMGINKPDVRVVIHTAAPTSIEHYIQQSGRAGRDGNLSKCIMFYSWFDKIRLENLINKNRYTSLEYKKQSLKLLDKMFDYCRTPFKCRHQYQLNYLQFKSESSNCNKNCDNCSRKKPEKLEYFQIEEAWLLAQVMIKLLDKHPMPQREDFIRYFMGLVRDQQNGGDQLCSEQKIARDILKKWSQNEIQVFLQALMNEALLSYDSRLSWYQQTDQDQWISNNIFFPQDDSEQDQIEEENVLRRSRNHIDYSFKLSLSHQSKNIQRQECTMELIEYILLFTEVNKFANLFNGNVLNENRSFFSYLSHEFLCEKNQFYSNN